MRVTGQTRTRHADVRTPPARRRRVAPGLAFLLLGGGLALSPVPAVAAGCSGVPGDVNGDGYAELAVGEPGNHHGAGAVHVFSGSRAGIVTSASGRALDDVYLTQATRGVPGTPRAEDRFGSATAFGDFDHDGCADLAVAAVDEGTVTIFRGSTHGLRTTGVRRLVLSTVAGADPRRRPYEASTLTVADLDGDGVDDLAVASARTPVGTGTGAVVVMFGDRAGLDRGATPAEVVTLATPGVPRSANGHEFAQTLANGDFDGDGISELAAGGRDAVQVVRVGPGRLGRPQPAPITPDSPGFPAGGHPDWFDFGVWPMAAGDVNGDGRADLAVGNPVFHTVDSEEGEGVGEGAVALFYGSPAGLTTAGVQVWTQASPGVAGAVGPENSFGYTVAMGHLDDGPTADLAIGAARDRVGATDYAGSVTVLLGSPSGLTTAGLGGTRFTQATAGIPGQASASGFGPTLAVSAVQSHARGSLVVGSPGAKVGRAEGAGSVTVLGTSAGGPTALGSRTLSAATTGVKGTARLLEQFGAALG